MTRRHPANHRHEGCSGRPARRLPPSARRGLTTCETIEKRIETFIGASIHRSSIARAAVGLALTTKPLHGTLGSHESPATGAVDPFIAAALHAEANVKSDRSI